MNERFQGARHHRGILFAIARQAMVERGLLPDFSPEVLAELDKIHTPARPDGSIPDLRDLPWASIDNDDSRDLDQLTVAEQAGDGQVKIRVAIADVDALVQKGTALDEHAQHNTTSVYTPSVIFPMLPEKLSTNLTSLNYREERIAVVAEMLVGKDGVLCESGVAVTLVRNQAKLAYHGVAAWLEGRGEMPSGIAEVPGLAENLRLQDRTAQAMKAFRHEHGALSFETIQGEPLFLGDEVVDLRAKEKNRAQDIIEDFMIAANAAIARFLSAKGFPSLRRVVRTPRRWDRIVDLVADWGQKLPGQPDSKALELFLVRAKARDPLRFPDISLAIIKLLGSGEYVADFPEREAPGHFGLGLRKYMHSTAPNRRYPDLITQRLLKAALTGKAVPYEKKELEALALHCTEAEDAAAKVERRVEKSAAALFLESRLGERFDGIVTGASQKGTWVRIFHPPVEGKLVEGFQGIDVGDRIHVQLISTNVENGFIDFRHVKGRRKSRR
ncbi:MAG: RNB domain-containing ribonuclease [Geobacteraceae bacterium]|nr:RNB domain-containing ribonuclease [Geobacteraceae bacterium]